MIGVIATVAVLMLGGQPAGQAPGATTVSPAVVTAPAPTATGASATPAPEVVGFRGRVGKNGLICTSAPVLGSRMPVRRCRSPEDVAARRGEDQQALRLMQRLNDPGH